MEMVNGYVFLDLTKANVYQKALKVLGADKPVVIKDGSNAPYFVDSLTLDGTNVVITKGGKTITIANDNTITNVGDIQNHLWFYRLHFTYSNSANDSQGGYVEFYSNKNVELNRNGLIQLLDNKEKNIVSYVNGLSSLSTTNTTLTFSIEYNESTEKFTLYAIDDETTLIEGTDLTDFEIENNSYRKQLF